MAFVSGGYYMAVTADRLELPLAIERTSRELGMVIGIDQSALCRLERNGGRSRKTYLGEHYKIVKVKIEDGSTLF